MSAFESVSKGLEEALAFANGNVIGAKVHEVAVASVDVAEVRRQTDLSQAEFAKSIGVAKGTLLNWEHGRRQPRECPEFCVSVPVHGGFKYSHALKRWSNIIANWLRAANHSRTFLPPFSKLRMAR